jgi:hypothetical protein
LGGGPGLLQGPLCLIHSRTHLQRTAHFHTARAPPNSWGRNDAQQLLLPTGNYYTSPVQMQTGDLVRARFRSSALGERAQFGARICLSKLSSVCHPTSSQDVDTVKSIQSGATAAMFGIAVTCRSHECKQVRTCTHVHTYTPTHVPPTNTFAHTGTDMCTPAHTNTQAVCCTVA